MSDEKRTKPQIPRRVWLILDPQTGQIINGVAGKKLAVDSAWPGEMVRGPYVEASNCTNVKRGKRRHA